MSGIKIVAEKDAIFRDEGVELLRRELGDVEVSHVEGDVIESAIREADALVIGPYVKVTRRILESAGRLKIVSRSGVGVDNVDIEAATRRGIIVTNVGEITANSVAEHTIALIFAAARSIPKGDAAVRAGRWDVRRVLSEENFELAGKVLGIVGLGRIGSRVAMKAKGLGMEVVYYDVVRKEELEKQYGFRYLPLEELLRVADVVSLHLPLTSETRNMFNAARLALLKPTAVLINQSRGAIVDEAAVAEHLKAKRLRCYATDVYIEEPPQKDNPLFSLDNVVLSPHIGGATRDALIRASLEVAKNIICAFKGERPPNIINPEVLQTRR